MCCVIGEIYRKETVSAVESSSDLFLISRAGDNRTLKCTTITTSDPKMKHFPN